MIKKILINNLMIMFLLLPVTSFSMGKKEKKGRKRAFTSSSNRDLKDMQESVGNMRAKLSLVEDTEGVHYADLTKKYADLIEKFIVVGERTKEQGSKIKLLEEENKKLIKQFGELALCVASWKNKEGKKGIGGSPRKQLSEGTNNHRRNCSKKKKKKKSSSNIYLPKQQSQEGLPAQLVMSGQQVTRKRLKKGGRRRRTQEQIHSLKKPADPESIAKILKTSDDEHLIAILSPRTQSADSEKTADNTQPLQVSTGNVSHVLLSPKLQSQEK